MSRFLAELQDQDWLPDRVRDLLTDYLSFLWTKSRIYHGAIPLIERVLDRAETNHVVDLCSGASGPWNALLAELHDRVTVTLTDKHPNVRAFRRISGEECGRITYVHRPIDATNVPDSLAGVRTVFSSFHHFPPDVAGKILQDACDQRAAICIFEMTAPSLLNVVLTMTVGPLVLLATTPWIRPVRLDRFVFTYLLPVVPLLYAWDGVVSHLHSYTCDELTQITRDVRDNAYRWEIGRLSGRFFPVTYLLGYPSGTDQPSATIGESGP